jgi:hypothetical protein
MEYGHGLNTSNPFFSEIAERKKGHSQFSLRQEKWVESQRQLHVQHLTQPSPLQE